VREGRGFEVRDVGSLNGTYVNRERIDEPPCSAGGDEVQIGKYRLVFLTGAAGEPRRERRRRRRLAGAGLLSIGEVLAQLRPDFPDITISKIRFLEAEGLVSPSAPASGYRKFTREPTSSGCATCCPRSATTTCR
jgi:pSer/pThr/pTyr-binding forkhead associated (FHA) protein